MIESKPTPQPHPTAADQHASGRLSPEQVAFYNREGFLLYDQPVFPQSEFDALKAHFESTLAALPADSRPEAMDVPHFSDPALFRWLFSDVVLDLVEPILGPDIALFSSHFICKPKGDGRRVPWHEDSAYWKPMVEPADIVTVWLALDPSSRENGCMYVVPRSHNTGRKGYSDYEPVDASTNVFHVEIVPGQRTDKQGVPCILQPNMCSLHDARTIHGSAANTSALRRCGYTMRYMGTHVKLSEAFHDYHNVYLARGKAKVNNPYGDPETAYEAIAQQREGSRKRFH